PAVFFNGISNKGLGLTKVFIGVVFYLFKAAPTGYFLTRLLRTVKVGERTYHPVKMLLRKLILFNKSMKKVLFGQPFHFHRILNCIIRVDGFQLVAFS